MTAVLAACVSVGYVRPGEHIVARAGEAVVFGRIRFVHDGQEYYPWKPSLAAALLHSDVERHFWLRRLDQTGVSPELHPEGDGSLTMRLAAGDYALLGTDQDVETAGQRAVLEIAALLRVPGDQAVVYAGDLVLSTRYREGWSVSYRRLGEPTVVAEPVEEAKARLEAAHGPLPGDIFVSHWCVGRDVPAFTDGDGPARARELLDRGCPVLP